MIVHALEKQGKSLQEQMTRDEAIGSPAVSRFLSAHVTQTALEFSGAT